jgi:large subunit ribosomal protein L10
MAQPEKAAAVAEIAQSFRGASAALLTEYRGLTVSQITELRRSLGEGARYAVVKNTLTRIAAREAGVDGIEDLLVGPTAVAFVEGDPVEAAKGLRDFGRAHPALVIKGGIVEGRAMSADDVRRLADLDSREVLLAKLAGAMKASLSQAARVVEALRQQREAAGEAGPAAVSEHASDEPAADAAAAPAVEAAVSS